MNIDHGANPDGWACRGGMMKGGMVEQGMYGMQAISGNWETAYLVGGRPAMLMLCVPRNGSKDE
jgi:hypothetical protein